MCAVSINILQSSVDVKSELVIDKVEPELTETKAIGTKGGMHGYIQHELPLQEATQRLCINSKCDYKGI